MVDFYSHFYLHINIVRQFPHLPLLLLLVGAGRHAHDFGEEAREVVGVGEAYLVADLVDAHVGEVEQGAGFWNSTPYGRELWQLMRVFGAGAVQL